MPPKTQKAIIQKLLDYAEKQLKKNKHAAPILSFLKQYYVYASLEDLQARTIPDLYGAALSHWQLMERRAPGEYKRRIFNPTQKTDHWENNHTILQFILDDQPFLVDTLCTELNRNGLTVHFIVHLGGVKVVRDTHHRITKVLPFDSTEPGAVAEAPIYIEIDKQTDPALLKKLEENLDRVVGDARAAVDDWQKMEAQIHFALEDLDKCKPPLPEAELEENKAFLHWLLDNRFTLLGFRNYESTGKGDKKGLRLIPNSGLGTLRNTENSKPIRYYADLSEDDRKIVESNQPILLAKTNFRSTVHGARYTDFISIKRFNAKGEIAGERWFVGLYTSPTYSDDPKNFPILRQKIADVLERSELPKNGHAYKALLHILKTLPRDDLFHATTDELFNMGMGILQLQDRRCIRLFIRKDLFGRFISCLVYVPRDDFNMELCYRMEKILKDALHALDISYTTAFSDSLLAQIHFTVRVDPKNPQPYNVKDIEQKLIEVGRSWKSALLEHLLRKFGEEKANELSQRYDRAFPSAYRENFSPATAVEDIIHLEKLRTPDDLGMSIYQSSPAVPEAMRFKLYHKDTTVPLSDAIPILEKMGLRVIGEQPYCIAFADGQMSWINDFNIRHARNLDLHVEKITQTFQDAFSAIWRGEAEADGFNALVLNAQLPWREIALLRAYAKYIKQIGITFSQDYIEQALCSNPIITSLLVQLFFEYFDPFSPREPRQDVEKSPAKQLIDHIKTALNDVSNLDEDRILRIFMMLIRATVRTNYFQSITTHAGVTEPKPYLSLKFNPHKIRDLILPRPLHEIFVYAPHFEGVHLRAGDVARGGIRWSDRREDFRREILGLMKAQQVKNAVIVPAGAKGGFVCKLLPADATRDAIQKEGIRCYQDFIRGLLDLTDNLRDKKSDKKVVHPENTICRDGDDTYLVVAADKGTASFSDIANQISKDYGYWLYDAFASGGSTGYDHKKIAITARGAWESVSRHFQELNIDIINNPFTVMGIGDMAGDVFGNGVLLSKQIKLVAAFNGVHIFLDPNPDPAISFKERQRLFNLPRSSWEDYNPVLISAGGGVYKRDLKSIKLSDEVKKALGIDKTTLTPNDLIQAILKAPVDLFWNGGIGTFVKSKQESNLDTGDRTNDAIRVNGDELRCRVVGEGGNLGFTQLGRIEYALNNGQINTDFIDNSGGVDCSDHEVNIKILLDELVAKKQMTEKKRNVLLAQMENQVVALVLQNNYRQARAVSLGSSQSLPYMSLYERYLRDMAKQGKINRRLEYLPTDEELAARKVDRKGLTKPEIAVLLAYSKIILKTEIVHSGLVNDPDLAHYVASAFPAMLNKAPYTKALSKHPLYGQVMATQLSNLLITDMGITFVYQMQEETGALVPSIVRAYIVMLELFDLQALWETIESLDVSAKLQTILTLELVRLMRRSVRWLLRNQRANWLIRDQHAILSTQKAMRSFTQGIRKLDNTTLIAILPTAEREYIEKNSTEWIKAGVPEAIAIRIATTRSMYELLNISKLTYVSHGDIHQIAHLYFALSDRLELSAFREIINDYSGDTNWMLLARSAAKSDLDFQQRSLTLSLFQFNKKNKIPMDSMDAWYAKNVTLIERWKTIFAEMKAATTLEYAMLVVVMRALSELAETALSNV